MALMALFIAPLFALECFEQPRFVLFTRGLFLRVVLSLCFGLGQYDEHYHQSRAEWAGSRQQRSMRQQFIDFKVLELMPPDQQSEMLAKVGWSRNDYDMLLQWFFMEDDLYRADSLNSVISKAPKYRRAKSPVQALGMFKRILTSPFAQHCWVVVLACLVFLRFRVVTLFKIGLCMGVATTLLFLVFYAFKPPPPRVYMPMFASLGLVALLVLRDRHAISLRPLHRVRLLGVMVVGFLVLADASRVILAQYTNASSHRRHSEGLKSAMSRLDPHRDQLYVSWGASYPWEFISPFDDLRFLQGFTTFQLGTAQRTPVARKILEQYAIENVYTALVERENVFLVLGPKRAERLRIYKLYMIEHYGKKVTASEVFEGYGFFIYRLDSTT